MSSKQSSVGVVFGGESGEHEVSIKSAITIIKSLSQGENKNRFNIVPIYIDKRGCWRGSSIANEVLDGKFPIENNKNTPAICERGLSEFPKESKLVDIWFPVLHGPNGEDGTIQGLFKLMNKPFVGSGVLGSAVGMDKIAMKAAFSSAGLSQVPYKNLNIDDLSQPTKLTEIINQIENDLTYPCFVKPANLGSSVGISKVNNNKELLEGIKKAANHDKRLVVEQGVNARELECGILGGENLQASVIGEIRFSSEWYDYETKYSQGASHLLIPAPIQDHIANKIRSLAIAACQAIGAYGMARVDFFYNEENHNLWINEINTLPGFTSQSMYPLLWEASGINLEKLVAKLVDTATE